MNGLYGTEKPRHFKLTALRCQPDRPGWLSHSRYKDSTIDYIPTLGSRLSDCLDGDGEVVRWVCGGKGTAVEVSGRRERCGCIDASQSQESVGAGLVDVEGIEEVRLEVNALSSIGVDVVSAEGERRIVKKVCEVLPRKCSAPVNLLTAND
jgi:hypothetical protein